ncbi:protein zwilch homolog isoform X2 [Paroedura picta]|uniref:protein zwilch homolog isoform X2 n=1 Tax=Paroedura picta TaxID=143630 RepID=UPI0040579BB1
MRPRGPERRGATLRLRAFVQQLFEEGQENKNKGPLIFETDVLGYLIDGGCTHPLENIWDRSGVTVVLEKAVTHAETEEKEEQTDGTYLSEISSQECPGPHGLSISRARQLISFYTMSQNPNVAHLKISNPGPLPPLWVRCDGADPRQTIWLGAETLSAGNIATGITLHTVVSNGPLSNKNCSANLEDLKESHRRRHHCTELMTKGFASYKFLDDTSLGSSLMDISAPPERNIYIDFAWTDVTRILQTPPSDCAVTLKFQMACGGPWSSVYEVSRELQCVLGLAEGLKTGKTEWRKFSRGKSAIEQVQKLLKGLQDEADELVAPDNHEMETLQNDTATVSCSMKTAFSCRGDLDFVEQLWCKLWRSVTSYEELVKCFKLILEAFRCGELQASIHNGSSGLLRKLIAECLRESTEMVSLSGDIPVQMFLEIGLDKMKRDYVSYFIGKQLALHSDLDYFVSTSVDLQEQVHRLLKLHHVLEIVDNCVDLLKLDHLDIIVLTQSCVKYYKGNPLKETHVFELPVKRSFAPDLRQNANLKMWRVEISSGRGQKEVKTVWQYSSDSPAKHLTLKSTGLLDCADAGNDPEGTCFTARAECNQVYFFLH